MSNDTDPTLPQPSALIDRPWFWRVLYLILAAVFGLLVWTGKTAWHANQSLNEFREKARDDAAKDTARELTGYLTQKDFLTWQISFEREQAARDDRIYEKLKALR